MTTLPPLSPEMIRKLRRAKTLASTTISIGGRKKSTGHAAKPITLTRSQYEANKQGRQ